MQNIIRRTINSLFRWTHRINDEDWEKINDLLVGFAMVRVFTRAERRLDQYLAETLESSMSVSYIKEVDHQKKV